ncbi:YrzQ family protein [Metabacillus sp. GX 13764]|nr:YrzQ family protein [Metabacillus kandeliae]MCD7032999.1 YrzQ family protein [Metabacillus kandeliae]
MMTSIISMGVGAAAAHYLTNGKSLSKRDWRKMQKRMRRMFS